MIDRTAGMSECSTPRPTAYVNSLVVRVRMNSSRCDNRIFRNSAGLLNEVPSGNDPAASIGSPYSAALHRPMALKFSRAKPIGSILLWQLAHTALLRCFSMRSRTDEGGAPPSPFSVNAGTFGGGAGGGEPRMLVSSHFPRTTGDVRVE